MRPVNETVTPSGWIAIDKRRSGYPCRCDPRCDFISAETLLRDAHELLIHGAVHVWAPIAYSYQSGFTKGGRSTLGRRAKPA